MRVVGERNSVVREPRGGLRLEQQLAPAALLTGGAGFLLRLLEGLLEAGVVHLHAVLFAHNLDEVHGEPEGFPQEERLGAGHGVAPLLLSLGGDLLELLDSLEQRAAEGFLLLGDDLRHAFFLLDNLREYVSEELHDRLDERREEALLGAQLLAPEPHRAPEHAPEHVVPPVAPRRRAVGDGEGQSANVVGDDSVRHVLLADVLGAELTGVGLRAGDGLDGVKDGHEHVGVVVGHLTLEDGREPLEAHAGVDVLRREGLEDAALLAVELDEDDVPDLEAVGIVHVDEVARVAAADAVVVDLGARTARADVSHLPEVVLAVKREHLVRGEVLEPDLLGLVVGGKALRGITAKVRGVEPVLGEHVHLREELPRPPDGLLLEKVAEGPVPEHLEEGVVVGVLADVVEVVVLAARADALLGVGGALELRERALRVGGAQEAGLELVHSRVGEEEGWVIVGDHGRGRHDGVLLALEEIQEGLPDPLGGPLLHGVHGWSVDKWVSGHGRVSGSGRRFTRRRRSATGGRRVLTSGSDCAGPARTPREKNACISDWCAYEMRGAKSGV